MKNSMEPHFLGLSIQKSKLNLGTSFLTKFPTSSRLSFSNVSRNILRNECSNSESKFLNRNEGSDAETKIRHRMLESSVRHRMLESSVRHRMCLGICKKAKPCACYNKEPKHYDSIYLKFYEEVIKESKFRNFNSEISISNMYEIYCGWYKKIYNTLPKEDAIDLSIHLNSFTPMLMYFSNNFRTSESKKESKFLNEKGKWILNF
jgi:hypothetical protein